MVITSAAPRQNLKPMQTGSALPRSFYRIRTPAISCAVSAGDQSQSLGNLIQVRTSVTRDITRMLNPKLQSINKEACFLWVWVSPVPMAHLLEEEVRDATGHASGARG